MLPNNVMEERKKALDEGRRNYHLSMLAGDLASQVKAANSNADWIATREFILAQLKK